MTEFFSYEMLISRLSYALLNENKKITFLIGSPASSSRNGIPGVADVDGIIELIRQQFNSKQLEELDKLLKSSSKNAYQTAINFLIGYRGQDAVNDLIRMAVINARIDGKEVLHQLESKSNLNDLAMSLEREKEKWHIPECMNSLAQLIKEFPENFSLQLTTNFDPLLSLAVQRQDFPCYRSSLSRDGSLNQTQGDGCHIVHLHGYWRGSGDTLHTPKQLTQPRSKLKVSLMDLLRNNIVVPIAYSGWDDIFTKTLLEVMEEDESKIEVLWAYYGANDADLISQNQAQISSFESGLASGRLCLYKGVDVGLFFKDLYQNILAENSEEDLINKEKVFEGINIIDEIVDANLVQRTSFFMEKAETDTIPEISIIFGRDSELSILRDFENVKIISINGIGGQGKSSIAAYYALECVNKDFLFIDWRDCREYDNTFQSILLKSIHYISLKSNTQIKVENLKSLSMDGLCDAFLNIIQYNKGIVIFDNIDKYIDLEDGSPINELEILLDRIKTKSLKSQVLFTSRPYLNILSDKSVSISLQGLTKDATKNLFENKMQKSISCEDLDSVWSFTNGHPLLLSLIGSKCKHDKKQISILIEEMLSLKGDVTEKTILPMWNGLNDKQKTVLRMLAEFDKPLTEKDFSDIDFDLNYNQISKAIRVLKSLSLIEARQPIDGSQVIDLHPLIKQYVRRNFPRIEREKMISKILLVIERKIERFSSLLKSNNDFSSSLLDWKMQKISILLNKADFEISLDDLEVAINLLGEIRRLLIDNGLAEEFVRLSVSLFEKIEWSVACNRTSGFDSLWSNSLAVMTELGKEEMVDIYLNKYKLSIQGKGAKFINYCNSACYRYWFYEDYEQAIYYGSQGVDVNRDSIDASDFDCSYHLALAWRDNGDFDKSLKYFLGQEEEDNVINPELIDPHKTGEFYGNVGRCFFFKKEFDKAAICYKKSALILQKDESSQLNMGYIRFWIGELLSSLGQYEDAAIFMRAALLKWQGFSPKRMESPNDILKDILFENRHLVYIMNLAEWRLENRFLDWIKIKNLADFL